MWGLEYVLLFGIPKNKIELIDGRSRWAFPFLNRELAEAHFANWLETLARWKGLTEPPGINESGGHWKAEVSGVSMELYPRPVEFHFPLDWKAFHALHNTFWRPEMWPGEQPARKWGLPAALDHQDVRMNLWVLFGELCRRHGGLHSGQTDIALSDTAAVAPDQYYYRKNRDECMIEDDYFHGAPDLIAEVLSPASRAIDRGPRMELYQRSGVPCLWLLDPDRETLEVYEREGSAYRRRATHAAGETFAPSLFPGEQVSVDTLFSTQMKRKELWSNRTKPPPIPEWIVSPETRLGLEYFFLLGHPEHRWEIWGNRAPSVLAFGSDEEARTRLAHFLEEACRWEGVSPVSAAPIGPDAEQAEVGRFRFTRTGRRVHLDVAVDARKYRQLLEVWNKRAAWSWGED